MSKLANGMVVEHTTILADGTTIPTDTRETGMNNNLLVVGGSGAGKSSSIVMPNIMQVNSSLVAVDPKGALYADTSDGLREAGYLVDLLDFSNPDRSTVSWNPFATCRDDRELRDLTFALVTEHGVSGHDPYWQEQASSVIFAIVKLLREEGETPTMSRVIEAFDQLHQPGDRKSRPSGFPDVSLFSRLDERFARRAFVREEPEPTGAPGREERGRDAEGRAQAKRAAAESRRAKADLMRARARRAALREEVLERFDITGEEYESYRWQERRAKDPALRCALREVARRERACNEAATRSKTAPGFGRNGGMGGFRRPGHGGSPKATVTRRESEAYDRWVNLRDTARETWSCIQNVAGPRLDVYRSPDLLRILGDGTAPSVDLTLPGRRVCGLYVVISDVNRDLDLLAAMLVKQCMRALVGYADTHGMGGTRSLDQPVRFILDDFANMAQIPEMDVWIAAVRSREIWITLVVQSVSQLVERYGRASETIMGNCDVKVLFTPSDVQTAEVISDRTGLPVPCVMNLSLEHVWVLARGHVPLLARRYDLSTHPNWQHFWLAAHDRMRESATKQR